MASALLGPLCQRVIDPVYEEFKLANNVKEEIKNLRFTVSLIEGVLQDAEDRQVKEMAVGTWLRSLKQVLYDAEDVLDEVATGAALPTPDAAGCRSVIDMIAQVCNMMCNFGSIDQFLNNRGIIAHQIKGIRMKLDDISKEKDRFGLRVSGGNYWPEGSRPRRLDTSSMLADKSCIIGRENERGRIIQWLLGSGEGTKPTSSKNNIQVFTIVGMGGVGKTTLAKLVFNDPTVQQHFQPMIWVCVSNDFVLKRITQEIMDAASIFDHTKGLCEISNWDSTQRRLKHKIEGKRFLLVLDDVWEEEDSSKWESLCEPLNYGETGSKILVTTRSQKVVGIVKGTALQLKSLSSEDLWPIFERYAFEGCGSHEHMQLVTMGREIVKKLKGSPLAAKTIGRLLNANFDVKYWKHILKVDISTLPQHENDIIPILKLSYNHLPGHLKQCFAYCSLFPKDHEFHKNELVQMWMAQNILQTRRGPHLESIGSEHFDDLQFKSLFEHKSGDLFVMHDLIHDLAELVYEDDCFRLEDNNDREILTTVRHMSIATKNFDPVKLEELCDHENMRTLLFLQECKFQVGPYLDNLFMKLQRLRVLRLQACNIKEVPTSIGTLKHLRFLDLSENLISKLPESLCSLHNLQVLNLQYCTRLGALPSNMSALINLRHLVADRELVSSIEGLGKLTALQELDVRGRKVKELRNMSMLRKLEIWALEEVESKEEAIQARLGDKEHLAVLKLKWSRDRDHDHLIDLSLDEEVLEALRPVESLTELTIDGFRGVRPPSWLDDRPWVFSSFLERVELRHCINWEVLPPLGQLSCLKILRITGMNEVRQIGPQFFGCCEDAGGVRVPAFPSLEELEFYEMPEWEEWVVPHGDDGGADDDDQRQQQPQQQPPLFLPRLRQLRMGGCPMLRQLPPLPPTLTELHLNNVGLTHLPGWSPSSSSSSPSLSFLYIGRCPNLISLRDGLLQQPLQNLKTLIIEGCQHLVSFPERAFGHLTSLKSLDMQRCPRLSWQPLVPVKDALPSSLERVRIHGCGEMDAVLLANTQKLTSPTHLSFQNCSKLMQDSGNLLPSSLKHLHISGDDHLDDESLSMCLRGLTSLASLSVTNCPAITSLPGAEALSHLTTLGHLYIGGLKELTSLGGIHSLVSLERLEINDCPKLLRLFIEATASSPSSSPFMSPPAVTATHLRTLAISESCPQQIKVWLLQCPSLQSLCIRDCPQLTCFDGDTGGDIGRDLEVALLNLAPFLRSLTFGNCHNLVALPPKMRLLSCLQSLSIYGCPQIQCLPVAGLPESLKELKIYGCPALAERCQEEEGPDWPLISRIPELERG